MGNFHSYSSQLIHPVNVLQLGKFDSVESLHDKDGEDDLDQDFLSKAPGPLLVHEPTLPAPPPAEFCELSMLEQSSYIFPILRNVLNNTYKPAEQRNLRFFKGGRQRVMLSESVHPKGTLTPQEYDTLGYIVRRWGLGCGSLQIEGFPCRSNSPKRVENVPASTPDLVSDMDQGAAPHHDDLKNKGTDEPAAASGNNESVPTPVHAGANRNSPITV